MDSKNGNNSENGKYIGIYMALGIGSAGLALMESMVMFSVAALEVRISLVTLHIDS